MQPALKGRILPRQCFQGLRAVLRERTVNNPFACALLDVVEVPRLMEQCTLPLTEEFSPVPESRGDFVDRLASKTESDIVQRVAQLIEDFLFVFNEPATKGAFDPLFDTWSVTGPCLRL